jgi:WD40 repeat protein
MEVYDGQQNLMSLTMNQSKRQVIALEPLSSTPFSTNMEQLSTASGRACFAACCTLPGDEYAINVWNQEDSHECYLSHSLEQSTPLGLDVHPRGTELVVSFGSKIQVYFVLQDSLRLAFELAQKQIGIVKYSPSGSLFAGVHTTNKIIYLYQSCTRSQREPQLVGTISRDFRETLTNLLWSPHDTSFFAVDTVGEIHHCALRWQAGGEVEELVEVHSATQVQVKGSDIICAAACKIDRDSHDYVVFSAERVGSTSSSSAVSSLLRAWVNGDLSHEALRGPMGQIGEHLPVAVSSLAGSCGVPNLLFGGTAIGGIAILSWKRGKLDFDGHRMIELSSVLRVVDVHTSAVSGLFFVDRSRTLVSNSLNGVVLSCTVITDVNRFSSERAEMTQQLIGALPNDFSSNFIDLSNAFTSICQPDEIGFYDRNKIELARFKAMDVENELQQLKLENEMLTRQLGEQRTRFEESMKREITAATDQAEEARYQLRAELSAQMEGAIGERESRMHSLSSEARAAQDHYLYNTEKIQRECDLLRETLVAARLELTDATKTRTEREAVIVSKYEEKIQAQKRDHETERIQLQKELSLVNKKLAEVLGQQQQDYSEQMTLLSSSIETEKKKLSEQQSQAHGKIAGLNQEVKMLLAALTAKDHELGVMSKECDLKAREIDALKARLLEEHRATDMAMKEKTESLSQYCELKGMYENLQRLDGVHRSQIEILQRHLLPKEQEIDKMQQYMGQLHDANQEIVVQANLSDRFRVETQLKAKKHEREVAIAQRQLERTRHSIEVLQEELGELVRISAIQEKNTLVCEIVRIHKRLTRQLDVLQAKDDGSEEVNAELHRQTSFLLKDKQHQRRQLEMVNQEKRKLASALSFQNTTLMTELNALKRQNKELERRLKRFESHSRNDDGLHMMVIQRDARTDSGSPPESQQKVIDDFMDGRAVLHSREDRPESLAGNNDSVDNSNTPKAFNTMTARGKPAGGRPQSAAPVMSKRPATAGLSRQFWSRK